MRDRVLHIAKLVSVFAFGVGLSSVFDYLVVKNHGFTVAENAEAAAPAAIAKAEPVIEQAEAPTVLDVGPHEATVIAKRGDTLLGVLHRGGINGPEAFEISTALEGKVSANAIQTGQSMEVVMERSAKNPELMVFKELKIPYPERLVRVTRLEDGRLDVNTQAKPLKKEIVRAGAAIYDSLMGSAEGIGIPAGVMQAIINAYSYDVDFQRDIQAGDKFEVVYESMRNEEGRHVRSGNVLYAQLVLSGVQHRIYYYTDSGGQPGFYTEDGKSVKRALLKTPINGARMTSGFGMRMHPVLGYSKMHRGVDFAAPVGTPIYAAGDGRVAEAGRKGTYGNYLRIRHNGEYSTAYAHLNRFASGLRAGSRVRQGQVVAYVGTTGRSTGPHLHFELIRGNTQINPSSVKSMSAGALSKREMVRFKRQQERLRQSVANLPIQNQVALLK